MSATWPVDWTIVSYHERRGNRDYVLKVTVLSNFIASTFATANGNSGTLTAASAVADQNHLTLANPTG
jgi:hypothetical protein